MPHSRTQSFTAPIRGVLARIPRPSALQDAAFAPADDADAITAAPVVVDRKSVV